MFQYYEMSYGLNVEMHKQVRTYTFYLYFSYYDKGVQYFKCV